MKILTLKTGISNEVSFCIPEDMKVQEFHDLLDQVSCVKSRYTTKTGTCYQLSNSLEIIITHKEVFTEKELEKITAEEAVAVG